MSLKKTLKSQKSKREYYRHRQTGELGYLVSREGKLYIQLDRPAQEILREFDKRNPEPWVEEVEFRPFAKGQITRVLYAADRELKVLLGAVKPNEWDSVPEEQQIRFRREGPPGGIRKDVYDALKEILDPLCR